MSGNAAASFHPLGANVCSPQASPFSPAGGVYESYPTTGWTNGRF